MKKHLARKMRIPISLAEYANTSCASIPLTICHCLGETVSSRQQLVLAGFRMGYWWAAVAIDSPGFNVLPTATLGLEA